MSLHRSSSSVKSGGWLTIGAVCLAALAGVQLVVGSTPIVWLLAACIAVWALLVQASHTHDSRSARVRSSHYHARR